MKFKGFWPDGSKIIDKPAQVAELLIQEERRARIAEIQQILREQSLTLSSEEKKSKLAKLFELMEEEEIARGGDFDTTPMLHTPSEEEKDRMYSLESGAANDSLGEADKLA